MFNLSLRPAKVGHILWGTCTEDTVSEGLHVTSEEDPGEAGPLPSHSHSHTCWIMDYLTNRPQSVRTQDCTSSTVVPQGTVLARFLFTLQTFTTTHLQRFSEDQDDQAVQGTEPGLVGLVSEA